jgi:hypothetical protein
MNKHRIAAICAVLAVFSALPARAQTGAGHSAPELGRLFFSPAEREALEYERQHPSQAAGSAPEAPARIAVDGMISRPGRPAIPIVNGRVIAPGESLSGLRISGRADGSVSIATDGSSARLAKPGQTVDLTTGDITELYDLQGRRRANQLAPALPLPYTSGNGEKVEQATPTRVIKAKKPRRHAVRRSSASSKAPPLPKTPPPAAQAPVPTRGAPAPAIPAAPPVPRP